jgi:O-antigen/teichoic acid export membrane protein
VWRTIAWTSGARAYGLAVGMLLLLLSARWLGPEGRGEVATVTSWMQLVVALGSLSLGQVALRVAARERGRAWLGPVLGTLLAGGMAVTLLGWAITATSGALGWNTALQGVPVPALLVGALLIPLLLWEQYGSALLMATQQLSLYNRALVGGRTLALVLAAVLVPLVGMGATGMLVATVCGQAVVAAVGLRTLWRVAEARVRPSWGTARELVSGGARLHLNAIGLTWVTAANVLLINRQLGGVQTGLYTTASDLSAVLLVVAQAAAAVLYSDASARGADASWESTRTMLGPLTLGAGLVAGAASLLGPPLIPIVLGARFAAAAGVFSILVWTIVPQTVTAVLAPQWVARGHFGVASALTLSAGVLNLTLTRLLLPVHGIRGAAWSLIAAYGALMLANLVFVARLEARRSSNAASLQERQA